MFCHLCSMTSIDGAPTPWVWVTRHQWLTGEKTHSRETRLQHQRFQNKWKCAIVEGGHRELGSYLSKVVSLGQVLGSSVETSSCLLDLTQQLLKDSIDATETPILVWTGQKEATEVCSATLTWDALWWFSAQPQVQRITHGSCCCCCCCWHSWPGLSEVWPGQLNNVDSPAVWVHEYTLQSVHFQVSTPDISI